MTDEVKTTKPSNFIRDQFILTVILVIAMLCRSSLVSAPKASSDIAAEAHSAVYETVVSTR